MLLSQKGEYEEGFLRNLPDEEKLAQIRFDSDTSKLIRVGWFTALALTIHNIPEGMLTYISSLSSNPGSGWGKLQIG